MSEEMTYEQARHWLDQVAKGGSVLGLEAEQCLLKELGDPQDHLKFIHIAGTNGKGSILAYLSTILKEAGYRVGRYISPTLFSYRERIQINEVYISREAVCRLVSQIRSAVQRLADAGKPTPTIFEVETAMAFLYFAEEGCDLVTLETGMGGDTDATNVIRTTVLEVLASISMDHMEYLGDTLAQIAEHKTGIIKPDTTVVSTLQQPEAMDVIEKAAARQHAKLCVADWREATDIHYGLERQSFSYGSWKNLEISLGGSYQIKNAVTALAAAEALQELGYIIPEAAIRSGFQKTVWNGRFTVLRRDPLVIIDGAHNPDGAQELQTSILTCLKGKKIYGICGVFRDKDYRKVMQKITPLLEEVTAIQTPDNPRALPAADLAEAIRAYQPHVSAQKDIAAAVEGAVAKAKESDGAVLAFGSLSFLGEIRKTVENMQ